MVGYNLSAKGYQMYTVSDALLAKLVEAVKDGEAAARNKKQVQSFEIYYDGFRSRMIFGRLMVIPAACADSREDFPSALLYGAIAKLISPEGQADLYTYKLGESEFDNYTAKDMAMIKDKIFMDGEGKYHSIVMFVPTWANVKDYVFFRFTKDEEKLAQYIRHEVYGAYFDPALSSAFHQMAEDTEKLNVSNITPQINFPELMQGGMGQGVSNPELQLGVDVDLPSGKPVLEKIKEIKYTCNFPILQAADGEDRKGKTAATKKPIMLLAGNADDIKKELLQPEETAVIDALTDEMGRRIDGMDEIETGIEAATKTGGLVTASTDDYGATTGLRMQPDYGESDSHTSKMNDAAMKGAALLAAAIKTADVADNETAEKQKNIDKKADVANNEEAQKPNPGAMVNPPAGPEKAKKADVANNDAQVKPAIESHAQTSPAPGPQTGEKEVGANIPQVNPAPGPDKTAAQIVVNIDGHKLVTKGSKLYAQSRHGHMESPRINGINVKFAQPNQFSPDFRKAVIAFIRNPRNGMTETKVAEVNQTFESIWGDIAQDISPAPSVQLESHGLEPKADPAAGPEKAKSVESDNAAAKPAEESPKAGPAESSKGSDLPAKEEKPWEKEAGVNPFLKEALSLDAIPPVTNIPAIVDKKQQRPTPVVPAKKAPVGDSYVPYDPKLASCDLCKSKLGSALWSEVAPNVFRHASCAKKAYAARYFGAIPKQVLAKFYPNMKMAEFNMFNQGDAALSEFYPDVQHEIVEAPGMNDNVSRPQSWKGPDQLTPAGEFSTMTPPAAVGPGQSMAQDPNKGAPLRNPDTMYGTNYMEIYHTMNAPTPNMEGMNKKIRASKIAAHTLVTIKKQADMAEYEAQFSEFLKKAVGEVAATFIAAFKVTNKPLLNMVPGRGQIQLDQMEINATAQPAGGSFSVASRVKFLLSKLTDSKIQDAINGAWAQAAVWNEDAKGGYTYEVFVRPASIDKDTAAMEYEFVIGTKGAEA